MHDNVENCGDNGKDWRQCWVLSVKVCFFNHRTQTELNWPEQVDPVTLGVHRRDGRGSIFLHPTQSITYAGKCDPTQPMDGPNPCPSLVHRSHASASQYCVSLYWLAVAKLGRLVLWQFSTHAVQCGTVHTEVRELDFVRLFVYLFIRYVLQQCPEI